MNKKFIYIVFLIILIIIILFYSENINYFKLSENFNSETQQISSEIQTESVTSSDYFNCCCCCCISCLPCLIICILLSIIISLMVK